MFAEITELREQREAAVRDHKLVARSHLEAQSQNRLLKAETVRETNNADIRLQELESEKRCLLEEVSSCDAKCKHLGTLLDQAVRKIDELGAEASSERSERKRLQNDIVSLTGQLTEQHHMNNKILQAYSAAKTALQVFDPDGMHTFLPSFDGQLNADHVVSTTADPKVTSEHVLSVPPQIPAPISTDHGVPSVTEVEVSPAGSVGTILPSLENIRFRS